MTIRTTLTIAAIAVLVALAVVPTLAQADPAVGPGYGAGQGPHGPHAGPAHGPQGIGAQGGPRAHMQGRQGQRQGPRGFVEATPESKALWQKLGDLKTQQHQAQWKMFELLSAEEVDIEALKAHRQTMRELNLQTREVMQQLDEYRKPLPFARQGEGQGLRGGQGRGQGHGQRARHGQGPRGVAAE